jgi:hypothetical protein
LLVYFLIGLVSFFPAAIRCIPLGNHEIYILVPASCLTNVLFLWVLM